MDKQGAMQVVLKLSSYYPRAYSLKDESTVNSLAEDMCQVFKNIPTEAVLQGAFQWHVEKPNPPAISELLAISQGFIKVDENERDETFSDPIEDSDGYVYAISSKTKQFVCVWKPEWASEEFAERVRKGTHNKGIGNPNWTRKYKIEELRKRGLVK